MKKTIKILLCVTLILALTFSLAACVAPGRYELSGMGVMGQTLSGSALDTALALAGESRESYYMQFGLFGSGKIVTPGETIEFEYEGNRLWTAGDPDDDYEFTNEDGVITITINFVELSFEK